MHKTFHKHQNLLTANYHVCVKQKDQNPLKHYHGKVYNNIYIHKYYPIRPRIP
jgi:hypothetical protein